MALFTEGIELANVVYGVTNANAITVNTSTPTAIATVSITPQRTSSRILIIATGDGNPNQSAGWHMYQIYRDSTAVGGRYINENAGNASKNCPFSVAHIDHPNTTSAVSYSVRVHKGSGSFTYGEQGNIQGTTILAVEILQ